jgi:hypothetical protein
MEKIKKYKEGLARFWAKINEVEKPGESESIPPDVAN